MPWCLIFSSQYDTDPSTRRDTIAGLFSTGASNADFSVELECALKARAELLRGGEASQGVISSATTKPAMAAIIAINE